MAEKRGRDGGEGPMRRQIVIIGAGFGGIGLGIKLKKSGLNDFVILEKLIPSAAYGAKIAIQALHVMCHRICIHFLSNRGPTGHKNTQPSQIYWPTSFIARRSMVSNRTFDLAPRSRTPGGTRYPTVG